MPGSNNNISILDASPFFKEIVEGRAPKCKYTINGNSYNTSLLKPRFHHNWDRGFGLCPFNVKPGASVRQSDGVGSGPVSQRLNGGSPETAPSVLKLRIMGAA
ncbi:hypothetical protein PCASD_17964 [Puccinia coronata f. sp. avenae]|uniref:Uncharacterized protein n=1 Tax=Puccinia coronata f. sp. avenae TaxID=200324 RepID=A0A2N5STM7_9BASI|nr:hypothetical protein PCASD_17964 [Puccinia coronata f. sp. avenae]